MKKKYLSEDYKPVVGPDGKKDYRYVGPFFTLELPTDRWKPFIILCWISIGFAVAAVVVAGLVDSLGLRTLYVALPYLMLMVPVALSVPAGWRLSRKHLRMTRDEHEKSALRLKVCAGVAAALAAATLVAEGICLLLHPATPVINELPLLLLMAAMTAVMAGFFRTLKHIPVQTDARGERP